MLNLVMRWLPNMLEAGGAALAGIYDWGLFQCMAWPVMIPWYLKGRYGSWALPLLGVFGGGSR